MCVLNYRLFLLCALLLTACSDGGGNTTTQTTPPSNSEPAVSSVTDAVLGSATTCSPAGTTVVVSGTVSYERVPFSSTLGAGLDYSNIQTLPVRGVEIQALGSGDCIINTAITDSTGVYSVTVEQNTDVKMRVKAKTSSTTGAIWDFEVRDNTSSNGLYVLDGSLVGAGSTNSTRNLTATSGWTGSAYGSTRSAAPFAILDSIYEAIQAVVAVDATINMDDADIFWSINNNTANGTLANGEIGDSFYSNDAFYILGAADSNTDEFDQHVIVHEWAHYFEDNLSRLDSVGGLHALTDALDMRVALSEGFANTFSGIVLDDSVYRDSGGASQASDIMTFDLETNASTGIGWFSEDSVQTILYDIFDGNVDANDGVNLGFSAIYNAMTSAAYTAQSSLASIFSLTQQIKSQNGGSSSAIDTLLTSQNIIVNDFFATGETNNGGDANNLPVYKTLADDGFPVIVCSSKTEGEVNKLGNRQFLRLNVVSAGSHNISISRVSGLAASNPDARVYLNGSLAFSGSSSVNNAETIVANLDAVEYILEVYDFSNTDNVSSTGGDVCFNVFVF
ncbi:MAG: hypothetical protein ACRBCI_14810 [Cellvibrionaceae bacterium]